MANNHDAVKDNGVIIVTQIKSPIGKKFDQLQTLIGLGLNKMNKKRAIVNSAANMGMINKVKHLLKIEKE